MPYAFSRTISDVLCTFKRFHNFIFHQSARWVYLGPGVKVGSLLWSARKEVERVINIFSPSVIGQFIYGNVKERRRWDQAIPLRCHGPFES